MIKYICDKCDKELTEAFDIHELHRIEFRGGYTSKFGDGLNFSLDLCDSCMYTMLEGFGVIDKGYK